MLVCRSHFLFGYHFFCCYDLGFVSACGLLHCLILVCTMSLRHCGVALWWFVYICCVAFPVFTCCVLICFTIDLVGRILTGSNTARMVGMVSPRASTRHDQSRTGPVQQPCRGQVEVMHYRTQLLIRLTLLTLLHKGRI